MPRSTSSRRAPGSLILLGDHPVGLSGATLSIAVDAGVVATVDGYSGGRPNSELDPLLRAAVQSLVALGLIASSPAIPSLGDTLSVSLSGEIPSDLSGESGVGLDFGSADAAVCAVLDAVTTHLVGALKPDKLKALVADTARRLGPTAGGDVRRFTTLSAQAGQVLARHSDGTTRAVSWAPEAHGLVLLITDTDTDTDTQLAPDAAQMLDQTAAQTAAQGWVERAVSALERNRLPAVADLFNEAHQFHLSRHAQRPTTAGSAAAGSEAAGSAAALLSVDVLQEHGALGSRLLGSGGHASRGRTVITLIPDRYVDAACIALRRALRERDQPMPIFRIENAADGLLARRPDSADD